MAYAGARHSRRLLIGRLRRGLAAGAGLVAMTLPLPSALAQSAPGALLSAACTSCHGVDGRSATAIPAIAGRPAGELAAALLAFRDGTREGTIMGRVAKGYTPEQIALLAAWFSER